MQKRNPTSAKKLEEKTKETPSPPTSTPTPPPKSRKKKKRTPTRVIQVEVAEGVVAGRRPSNDQVIQRQDAAYRLRLLGKTCDEIAEALVISPRAAYEYIDKARKRQVEELKKLEGRAGVLRQFQVLNYILDEMLEAWERSKRVKKTKVAGVETKDGVLGGLETKKKTSQKEEEEIGDPSYLDRAMKASREIRELLGLDAPEVKRLLVSDDPVTKNLSDEDLRNLPTEELLRRYRAAAGLSSELG